VLRAGVDRGKGESGEHMEVMVVDGAGQRLASEVLEFLNHRGARDTARRWGEVHGIAREQCARPRTERVVGSLRWWSAIVALDVLTMVACAPPARIAPQPRSVG
jgi:hypothetical protein